MDEPNQVETEVEREPLTVERVRELLEDAQYAPWGYGAPGLGRGDKCLAVSTDSISGAAKVILDVVQACAENGSVEDVMELTELLKGSRSDALGHDTVVYWPEVDWADCGGDGTDEDDECDDDDDDDEYLESSGRPRGDREDFHSDG